MSEDENISQEGQSAEIEPVLMQAADAKERIAADAVFSLAPGVVILLIAAVVFYYQRSQGGLFSGLGVVLGVIGIGLLGFGIYRLTKVREVEGHPVECPFCQKTNILTAAPESDFRCIHCNREVPIEGGKILNVYQVRCGYCNTLNYYSEKSTGLICESCDREIPIATDEQTAAKKVFEAYTIHDDDQPYDLILVKAPDSNEMISCLQQMLALNRNQVKELLDELPQTLLTGIPKKKAELLTAQIAVHKGVAENKVSGT
ncbi:MAG: hypothetical protein JNM28_05165 [Armatimonadetes bacterium]|nr:hypothetical protein [Armatimonadota bacterium]MBS1712434.1 hypothetical protein [Armatimonadota bacterium]MBX3109257.1 hypothetical protein [Fimbriimonadaceae bacterium]